jgi:hypothetical protein
MHKLLKRLRLAAIAQNSGEQESRSVFLFSMRGMVHDCELAANYLTRLNSKEGRSKDWHGGNDAAQWKSASKIRTLCKSGKECGTRGALWLYGFAKHGCAAVFERLAQRRTAKSGCATKTVLDWRIVGGLVNGGLQTRI